MLGNAGQCWAILGSFRSHGENEVGGVTQKGFTMGHLVIVRAVLVGVLLSIISVSATAAPTEVLVANLQGVSIRIGVNAAELTVGAESSFEVTLHADADAAPNMLRARLGMPDHGHWITEEKSYVVVPEQSYLFPAAVPMFGKYRFRIWMQFGDGHEEKTGIDILLLEGQPMSAQVIE